MNFTAEIKKEMIKRIRSGYYDELTLLSSFLRSCAVKAETEGKKTFLIVSETEFVAEVFVEVFEKHFGKSLLVSSVGFDKTNGKGKLLIEYTGDKYEEVFEKLGLNNDLSKSITGDEEKIISYSVGCFLGGGSATVPSQGSKNGYHIEFSFQTAQDAKSFCETLEEIDVLSKVLIRPSHCIVYANSKEIISDFLAMLDLNKTLENFSDVVERRDKSNYQNRTANCIAGNADKQAQASVKMKLLIEKIKSRKKYELLDPSLKETAKQRVENPTLSIQELADKMGISKSCLNHRLRKLAELSKKYEGETE